MPKGAPTRFNLSRREFTRGVAMAAATTIVPKPVLSEGYSRDSVNAQAASAEAAQLTPDAETQVQVVLTKYGKRLSNEQIVEVRRLITQAQKASAALHSFPLENSDEPAMVFHVYRR